MPQCLSTAAIEIRILECASKQSPGGAVHIWYSNGLIAVFESVFLSRPLWTGCGLAVENRK